MADTFDAIVLFREYSEVYEQAFAAAGGLPVPVFVPVLSTENVQCDSSVIAKTNQHIREGSIAAVAVTSARAVSSMLSQHSLLSSELTESVPWYAVGKATEQACRQHGVRTVRGGSDTGNAKSLAQYIVNDLQDHESMRRMHSRVLFPCGEKRLDNLPATLTSAGIAVDDLIVYKTAPSSTIVAELRHALSQASLRKGKSKVALVFFSPSGFEAVVSALSNESSLRTLQLMDRLTKWLATNCIGALTNGRDNSHSDNHNDDDNSVEISFGSIGATTAAHLHEVHGVAVPIVAANPTAADLVAAIESCLI